MAASKSKNRKRKKLHLRSVYVIARPLHIGGHLSFLSDGKFPLCHWGLLVTKVKRTEMCNRMRSLENVAHGVSDIKPWGTMFELQRDSHNKNTHNVIYNFEGEEWYIEWKHILMAFIGTTNFSDNRLTKEGEIIIN